MYPMSLSPFVVYTLGNLYPLGSVQISQSHERALGRLKSLDDLLDSYLSLDELYQLFSVQFSQRLGDILIAAKSLQLYDFMLDLTNLIFYASILSEFILCHNLSLPIVAMQIACPGAIILTLDSIFVHRCSYKGFSAFLAFLLSEYVLVIDLSHVILP